MKVKKFELKNLDCAHCAGLIDKELERIDTLNNHSLNFATKELKVEIYEEHYTSTINKITEIIKKIEDVVEIVEKDVKELKFRLENLFCQACSIKIEEKILSLDSVSSGFYNFSTQILNLKVDSSVNSNLLKTNIQNIVDSIEEGVTVVSLNENKSADIEIKFELKNLFCQSCAGKIEKEILDLKEVSSGHYNFATQTLTISVPKTIDKIGLKNSLQNIIDSIEDGVIVNLLNSNISSEESEEDYSENKKELIINTIGAVLFFILISFENINYKFPLFLIAYLLVGSDVVLSALKNLKNRNPFDENFLMTLATIGAFGIGEYPEAVAVMLFYKVGEYFQSKAVTKSRNSIASLLNIKPEWANIEVNGVLTKVSPSEVSIGDTVVVHAGESVPLDGLVLKGLSSLDTKALTGESLPVDIKPGDSILSGSININSTIEVQVTRDYSNSTVAKILDLVENASMKKAKTEKFITTFSKYYTPIVVFLAAFVGLILPLFIGDFHLWFYRALIFLVISCPCALVVSIPLGYFGGIGRASKHGILIKGSNYLEALTKVTKIIVDKTGTLTKGTFSIKEICPTTSETELLNSVFIGENGSNHPIAIAIKNSISFEIDRNKIESFEVLQGFGTKTVYDGHIILVGNKKLMEENSISIKNNLESSTIIHVSKNNVYLGYLSLSDSIKDEAEDFVKNAKKNNLDIIMLSGDNEKACSTVADTLGIKKFYHSLLPNDKVNLVEKELNSNGTTIFVGDGINDAPVLKRVDIGISMGGVGSDAAIEASDIVIMDDKLSKVIKAIEISKKTKVIVIQNIIFALSVKIIILTLGLGGHANMWEAIFADVGVALIAIFNSIRALRD